MLNINNTRTAPPMSSSPEATICEETAMAAGREHC